MLTLNFSILNLLIAFVIIYTLLFWAFDFTAKSKIMAYMSDLGMFVALFGFVLSQLEEIRQRKIEELTAFNQQQEASFIEIERLFMKYYPDLFPFYKELNSHNPTIQSMPNPTTIDPARRLQLEANIFNIIIQRIENIFVAYETYEDFSHSDFHEEWMKTWRKWFTSPTMQRLWQANKKIFFATKTINLIDNYVLGRHTLPLIEANHKGLPVAPNSMRPLRQTLLSKGHLLFH